MYSEEASEPESESAEEEDSEIEEEPSDEDEEEDVPAVRPYAALIQSLAIESGPRAKRRKLDHTQHEREAQVTEGTPHGELIELENAKDADDVEEAEEGPETAIDGLLHDDEDIEDASDPFESHFANPDKLLFSQRLKHLQQNKWDTEKATLQIGGKAVISIPTSNISNGVSIAASISSPEALKLKSKLSGAAMKQRPSFDKLEGSIAPFIFNYEDVLFCDRRPANAENLRRLTCLHAVNHIFK